MLLKHIHLYIPKVKKDHIKLFNAFIVTNFLLLKLDKKDTGKTAQGNQELSIISIINVLLVTKIVFINKGDIPFTIYFDFETTTTTDKCLDPEQKKIFVVSYVMIVAFHPALKLDRTIIYRSFANSLEQLTTLNYFSREQISFIEPHLIKILRDITFDVSKKKCKNSVGQMFSTESAMFS